MTGTFDLGWMIGEKMSELEAATAASASSTIR